MSDPPREIMIVSCILVSKSFDNILMHSFDSLLAVDRVNCVILFVFKIIHRGNDVVDIFVKSLPDTLISIVVPSAKPKPFGGLFLHSRNQDISKQTSRNKIRLQKSFF